MDFASLVRKPARAAAFLAVTASAVVACEGALALGRKEEREQIYKRHLARYVSALIKLFRVELRVLHGVPPKSKEARLVIANHRSALDVAALLQLFEARIVSRADLSSWPILGRAARLGGTIFVDREQGGSRATALRAIRTRLEEGYTVGVFAEGGTFEGDEVRELHPGAFLAARGLDVDIVPVGFAYEPGTEFIGESFVEHLGKIASRPRTKVVISIGAPIPIRNGARELSKELQARIQALVYEARAELSRMR